jgi:hypothetical protein
VEVREWCDLDSALTVMNDTETIAVAITR